MLRVTMTTNNHTGGSSDTTIFTKLSELLDQLLEPPSHNPSYQINSVERENGKIYKVDVSLMYTFTTPALINTVTNDIELIFVRKNGDLMHVPQKEYHNNMSEELIEDCKSKIREEY